jgi:chitinase
MKNKKLSFILVALLSVFAGCKKEDSKNQQSLALAANGRTFQLNSAPARFKIVAYFPAWNLANIATVVDFNKVTHLNIAFINPGQDGTFAANAELKNAAELAHAKNVKVLAAIAGGSSVPAYFLDLITPANQPKFIAGLIKLTEDNCLDGIDVDIENEMVNENYESFVTNLGTALKAKGKLMTAAVSTANKFAYTAKALANFDYLNIMSYDKTGSWAPQNPGPHSPYSMAVEDLAYWGGTAGIAKDKLILGVPFYGYEFGPNGASDHTFADIVAAYPGSQNFDQVNSKNGGIIYYNGIPTIEAKSKLALQNAGGIMIWNINQDAVGENSLLNKISAIVGKK